MIKKVEFTSVFFTLYEIGEKIYAAIEKPDMGVGSNAGFFDLGNHVVVFDTFLNLNAAKDLNRAVEEITGNTVKTVIISHIHTDHIIGVSAFPAASNIISSPFTYSDIMTNAKKDLEEVQNLPESDMDELRNKAEKGETEEIRKNAANTLNFYDNLRKPGIKIIPPNITISEKIILYGDDRNVELINIGSAHTQEDVIAYLPDEKIVFMGDLLFANRDPWIGSGNPKKLVFFLIGFIDNDIEIYVPGHGELATKKEVELQIQYVNELLKLVKNIISETPDKLDTISKTMLSPAFHKWNSPCFGWNINFLANEFKEKL